MRYIETILKLAFLGIAIAFIWVPAVGSPLLCAFLIVCLLLGIVLIFNKDASYHFPQAKSDIMMRRIEGVLLVAFSIAVFVVSYM